jgi:hydrogenase-4 component B
MPGSDIALTLAPAAIYLLGVALALLTRSGRAAHLVAMLGSAAGVGVAGWALLGDAAGDLHLATATPFANLSLRLDPLAAFFLGVISLVAIPVSLYAIGYLEAEPGSKAGIGAAYNAFLAALGLVVLADSVLAFLIAWEGMSLASFFLVMHDHRKRDVRRAGFVYQVMTHFGTGFILLAFLALFAATGGTSLDFAAFRAGGPGLAAWQRDLVFLLALVGFGTKAGVIPLHVWLPRAHPAAPSHVSALMSGVMIKTALYGLLRVGWEFAGPGPTWWGGLLLALGAISAVLGVLYALLERDLKRLLAYSSVENIGIMLLGFGAAFLLASIGRGQAAALALLAALAHVLNHGIFKGLLFLGAGAIQHATHTRDLERLGGLIRRMPWTAATFLVGAASIAAILPLNGFQSEWLTLQALLQLGVAAPGPLVVFGAALAAGALALTGGLAAFTFVKAFAVAFLGVPRTAHAETANEAAPTMRAGMALLALLCVVLGVVPAITLRLLAPVTTALTGAIGQPAGLRLQAAAAGGAAGGRYAPLAILALVVALAGGAILLARLLGGRASERIAPPWVCGVALEPQMQYTATALTKALRIIFRALVRPYRQTDPEYIQPPYFIKAVRYQGHLAPVYERYLYRPVVQVLMAGAKRLGALQNGQLRTYLAYLFATLVVVLLIVR